jgi:hypothetical protein
MAGLAERFGVSSYYFVIVFFLMCQISTRSCKSSVLQLILIEMTLKKLKLVSRFYFDFNFVIEFLISTYRSLSFIIVLNIFCTIYHPIN